MKNSPHRAHQRVLSARSAGLAAGAGAPATAVVITPVADMHRDPERHGRARQPGHPRDERQDRRLGEERRTRTGIGSRPRTPIRAGRTGPSLLVRPEGEKPYASEGPVFEVTSLFANIYDVEDVTEGKPMVVAPFGARLEAGTCGERWCDVTLPCGAKGCIQNGDGEIRDAAAPRKTLSPEETVALAKRFLGVTYLWGGNDRAAASTVPGSPSSSITRAGSTSCGTRASR